jgi:Ca2+-binding RTX toxin-like protein/ABC-type uncharacterized transport system ATPase subunit
MTILNVGPNSFYATIADAMAAAAASDTIQLEAGYNNETATITHDGMIISGEASSTGIVLQLGTGIATFFLAGSAPINVLDSAVDGNGIAGNDGDNIITVTGGADAVSGGLGIDRLVVDYRLTAGAVTGNSTTNVADAGGLGLVTINGGFEHFTILTGSGADTITTGAGDDIISTGEGASTVVAGAGANVITGGGDADTVTALDGGNIIDGGGGANTLTSGDGNDVITGGVGVDVIVAGGGSDAVTVRGGADTLNSGAGDDRLIVDYSAFNAAVTGGVTGGDLAIGYSGRTADLGGNSIDFLTTENFTITTGGGNDNLTTGDGVDVLTSSAGSDRLDSGGGVDTLVGGLGNDTLIGGAGNDRFNYVVGDGADATDGGADDDTLAITGTASDDTINVVVTGETVSGLAGGTVAGIEHVMLSLGGGSDDTLDYTGTVEAVTVDLSTSSASGFDIIGGVENVIGGSGGDTLIGDANANDFVGGGGDDAVDGGGGIDTAIFTGARANYTINTLSDSTIQVIDNRAGSSDGTDSVSGIEFFRFSDQTLGLNSAPVFTNLGPAAASNEQTFTLLDGDVTIQDAELDALNNNAGDYAGSSVTVARSGGANPEDDFGFDLSDASFTLSGNDIQSAGVTFAAFINANGTQTISFSGTTATTVLVNDVVSHLTYANQNDNPPTSITLDYTFNDGQTTQPGGAQSVTLSLAVNIDDVNDAPAAVITPASFSATEQTALGLKNAGLSVSDVDGLGGVETVTLSVTEGTLSVTAGGSGAGIAGSGTSSVTLTGTIAQINALLNTDGTSAVSYIDSSDNPSASAALTLAINDGGATGGGSLTTQDTATINITAVNDAPAAVIVPASFSATEQTALDLKNAGLSVSDVDGLGGIETVTLSVTEGTLSVTAGGSGAGVAGSGTSSVTLTGTIAQINALLSTDGTSAVSYIDSSDNPSASATLTLAINDGGATGGGSLTAQDTATINITAANDAPSAIITPASFSASEQTVLDLKNTGLSVSDVDANSANVAVTLSVTEGMLSVSAGGSGAGVAGSGTGSVTLTGTIAQINALLSTDGTSAVSYIDSSNIPSASATLTLAINDGGATGGGPLTAQDTATINITAANDAPAAVITPASFSATEQTALGLKNAGLSVSDVDGLGGIETVTLSVTEGTLSVTAGGSGAGVAGSGTSSVTLTGTIAQINALLNTDGTSAVSYIDSSDNPSTSATLTLAINDGGATGGGSLTAQDTATINITAVNDTPAAVIGPASFSASEQTVLDLKNTGLSVSDVDANSANVAVTLSVTEGTLSVTAGGSGTGIAGSGTGSVTLTGTIAQINALLNTDGTSAVSYIDSSNTPSTSATLTLAINDGGATGGGSLTAQDTATINITAANDIPQIDNLTPSIAYSAGAPPQVLSSGANIFDADNANLASSSVTLTDHQTGDELSVNGLANSGPVNGIAWTYTAATGVLLLTGSSSLANYQLLLEQVQYRSTSGDPSNGGANPSRSVAWVVNDGTDPSLTQNTTINLGNQAPMVDLNGGGDGTNADQSFFQGGPAVGIASSVLSITDPDDATLISATIVLTNAKPSDSLLVSGALPSGLTSNITTGPGTITVALSGNASRADYTAAIQQVRFDNTSGTPDTADRTVTVTVHDGDDSSNSATTTVHFDSLDDAPVNTVPGTQNVEANTATAIGGLSIADPDAASDMVTTTLSVAHGVLTVASPGGAAVAGSGTATITLTGTVTEINTTLAAANNINYAGTHDYFGTDALTVTTDDGGNTGTGEPLSDTDQVTINVNTLNTGTTGNDSYNALPGQERIDAGLGIDTVTFGFKLVDATVKYQGNEVIIDGPTGSHTVLTGLEVFNFTDGTVNNNDGSPLTDDLFYNSRYHDVWNAHVDADTHYDQFGWHEGRDPSAFFSTSFYLSLNQDVRAAAVNPLTHYEQSGWSGGEIPSTAFDGAKYLQDNPDVAAAHVDPLEHFLQNGAQEGRQPFAVTELLADNGFDYVYYLQHNPDVAAALVDPLQHFETVGWMEGRNPNALFDTTGYLSTYGDIAAAGINPLDHYHTSGWQEGRDPSPNFDTTSYLAAYSDVAAANVDPLQHFLQFGIHEGRQAFADATWG